MGSIPIARSRSHDDSIGFTQLNYWNPGQKWPFLDPKMDASRVNWTLVFVEKTCQSGGPTILTGPSFAPSLALLRPRQA